MYLNHHRIWKEAFDLSAFKRKTPCHQCHFIKRLGCWANSTVQLWLRGRIQLFIGTFNSYQIALSYDIASLDYDYLFKFCRKKQGS